jgi:hypothetical protein
MAEATPKGMPYSSDKRNGSVMPASANPKIRMTGQCFRIRPSILGGDSMVKTIAAKAVLSHAVPASPRSAKMKVDSAQLSSTAMTASSMSAAGGRLP